MTKERAVIYTRVSGRKQAAEGKTSLADQERSCRALAAERGWKVLEVVQDRLTGTNADRPGLTLVRELVETGNVTHVVVWDTSRFMRNLNLAQLVQAELQIAGADIHFVEQSRTGNDLADAIMRTVHYAQDQIENEKRRKRTQPKRLEALRSGRWIFPPPYGYRLDKETGRVLVSELEAETLRLIFELYLDGHPNSAIVAHLEREGRPTRYGKPWNTGTLARLITNADTYAAGELRTVLAGEPFTHSVEPLTDRATMRRLQERRTENTSHRGASAADPSDHLLRKLLTCTCGRTWQSKRDPRNGRLYYRCPNSRAVRSAGCAGSIGDRTITDQVWPLIHDNLIAEDAGHMWIRRTATGLEDSRGDIEAEVAEAERLLRGLDKERLNLDRQLVKGAVSETNHARLTAENDAERVIVGDQLATAQAKLDAVTDAVEWEERASDFVDRAAELSTTPEGRQVLCRTLIKRVLVTRDILGKTSTQVEWRVEIPGISTTSKVSSST